MHCIRDVYAPFILGFTGRVQTVLGSLLKKASKLAYEKEMISFSDGGEMKLSWYAEGPQDASCPIAIVLPGLTGCACTDYITTIVKSVAQQGYRCVVLNNRGTCGQKLKTPRTYSASDTEDVSDAISIVHKRYPEAPLTAVGISMGALILFNYISSFGEDAPPEPNYVRVNGNACNVKKKCPLRAGLCISMPWKLNESCASLEKSLNWLLFNRPLTSNLCEIVNTNAEVLSDRFDVPRILRSRSIREFDENLTTSMFGFSSTEEYYNQASPALKLDAIKVPLLCFVAADDPFVPLSSIPLKAISQSSHVMLVLTRHGGHIGFLDDLRPTGPTLMDRVAAQFCSAVFENLDELSASLPDADVAD
ncbi:Phospholipase abhd3 [Sparganum proliferum]